MEGASFVDGALLSNDPTLEVFKEAASFRDRGNTAFNCILSIGTGAPQRKSQRHNGLSSTQRALVASLRTSTATVSSQIKELFQDAELHRYWRFEAKDLSEPKHRGERALESFRRATHEHLENSTEKQRLVNIARVLVK
jgi:hypothetical protein